MSGENVDLGDPGNLVPEYDSADDMDVEVKVEVSFHLSNHRVPSTEYRVLKPET
ncbi:hypothetical protein EDB19DRAFT_1916690 [Suillus lakei]|nr:hypothetical protein EDB19DRAFT_1916690 [Suillus lakei]